MRSERIEIGSHTFYPTVPSESLLKTVGSKDKKFSHYQHRDYQLIQAQFKAEAAKESNDRVRRANESLLNTIDAIHNFAMAAKYEAGNPTGKWQRVNKLKAVKAAELTMFTADALSRHPTLLELFWGRIYRPLVKSGGLIDSELEPITNGLMAELATGKALAMIFKKQGQDTTEILKTTPEEDVNDGQDLVVKKTKTEQPIQVKLMRGGAKPYVRWVETGKVSEVWLYYGRKVEELFDPQTGQPTTELIEGLHRNLPPALLSNTN
ncbi:MAG: hypothetical protein HY974_03905 [Candidatus Kerfeldbacteria bacterium]|nr:hypothetical protein [Candidatus Kerfeldbacteria bacterium]